MKTAIVCEGGGMRGIYTSGVLQAFMDMGFEADALYGVSAGATNGLNYISRQNERGLRTNTDYAGDKRYLSLDSFLKTGSAFGMDFIFRDIPESLDPFDYDTFYASQCDFYAGVTDVETGRAAFFGKEDLTRELEVIRASCALPVFSKMVEYKGRKYMDGGIADPIPVDQPLKAGFERIIVILTRHRGFVKKGAEMRAVYHQIYRAYPNFVRALDLRPLVYNHTLARLGRLEEQGRVAVVAPGKALKIDRFTKNRQDLLETYDQGMQDGLALLGRL